MQRLLASRGQHSRTDGRCVGASAAVPSVPWVTSRAPVAIPSSAFPSVLPGELPRALPVPDAASPRSCAAAGSRYRARRCPRKGLCPERTRSCWARPSGTVREAPAPAGTGHPSPPHPAPPIPAPSAAQGTLCSVTTGPLGVTAPDGLFLCQM